VSPTGHVFPEFKESDAMFAAERVTEDLVAKVTLVYPTHRVLLYVAEYKVSCFSAVRRLRTGWTQRSATGAEFSSAS